jgi:hypothetical protein
LFDGSAQVNAVAININNTMAGIKIVFMIRY